MYTDTVFPAGQSVTVGMALGDARSCAAVSFRVTGTRQQDDSADFYRVAVCSGETTLISSIDGGETVIATAKRATATGAAHQLRLVADEREAVVAVDGAEVLRGPLTEASLISGRVLLGATEGTATFTDAGMRSGTDPAVPARPAFLTGDAQITAGLWMTYDRGKVSILEPTEFLTGADYCRRFALTGESPQCAQKFVPVPSSTQVSLPIAENPRYLDYRRDPAKCRDPRTLAGTCAVPFREFATTSGESSPWPGLVTIRGGQVTSVARLDIF